MPANMPPSNQVDSESLNVIALVSGGKDSFFSLLHCLRNGHKLVALGNLYPPPPRPPLASSTQNKSSCGDVGGDAVEDDEKDLNSFMYQTVGHSVIPCYEKFLGVPLYRQEILGGAVQTGTSYASPTSSGGGGGSQDEECMQDETESLVPLLWRIKESHPEANAICSGAILSTYQRTRIESVALRLDLVPLAYLWQYPVLPPHTQTSLLEDMYNAGLEARIVKVASGGLDEGWLWERVSEPRTIQRMERRLKKFGVDGDGAVIGEGGEYETIVIDGPRRLFKGRVKVDREKMAIVKEGGGSAWLKIDKVDVEMKELDDRDEGQDCRVPDILESRFEAALRSVVEEPAEPIRGQQTHLDTGRPNLNITTETLTSDRDTVYSGISEEAAAIITSIQQYLTHQGLASNNIVSSLIILRSMSDFQTINKIYNTLFPHPNPPSRVTVSCGSSLPANQNLQIHLTFHTPSSVLNPEEQKKALHVQSRSYWAPANIGPYSQAIAYSHATPPPRKQLLGSTYSLQQDQSSDDESELSQPLWLVKIAGQIPLMSASMCLPAAASTARETFRYQAVLALQHLWRIGVAMDVKWFVGGVAYIPSSATATVSSTSEDDLLISSSKARIVGDVWKFLHQRITISEEVEDENDDIVDVWHQRHNRSLEFEPEVVVKEKSIPAWDLLPSHHNFEANPPIFTVEVDSLPRDSGVEWHAFTGLGAGARTIVPQSYTSLRKHFTLHQVATNSSVAHTIISIRLFNPETGSPNSDIFVAGDVLTSLQEAGTVLGVSTESIMKLSTLTYLNENCEGLINEGRSWKGVVPCKGIWDPTGDAIAGVWVLEGVL